MAGAENQIVSVAAPDDWLAVIPPDAANTKSCPVVNLVFPSVLPVLLTPRPRMADWFVCEATPEIEIVVAPAAVACDNVMLFVPTRTNLEPVFNVVFPCVLPPVETPIERMPCVCTDWVALIVIVPPAAAVD